MCFSSLSLGNEDARTFPITKAKPCLVFSDLIDLHYNSAYKEDWDKPLPGDSKYVNVFSGIQKKTSWCLRKN